MKNNQKIAFIGGGNMTSAIVKGLISNNPDLDITVFDRNENKCQNLQKKFGVKTSTTINDDLSYYFALILSVKPQVLQEVCGDLSKKTSKQLIISVAAGVQINSINNWLHNLANPTLRVVRIMPNTPSAVSKGMSGAFAQNCNQEDIEMAELIMSATGKYIWLKNEKQIDALTAISGSGPAYFYYFCECLAQAGVDLGLEPEVAMLLARQTFIGAASLIENGNKDIGEFRKQVTSKGGTTEQALLVFQQHLPQLVSKAANAAKEQSEKLAKL